MEQDFDQVSILFTLSIVYGKENERNNYFVIVQLYACLFCSLNLKCSHTISNVLTLTFVARLRASMSGGICEYVGALMI